MTHGTKPRVCGHACTQSLVMFDSFDPIVCSLPGSSVRGILQARILEWVAISFSRGSSDPVIEPTSPTLAGRFFIAEPPGKPKNQR